MHAQARLPPLALQPHGGQQGGFWGGPALPLPSAAGSRIAVQGGAPSAPSPDLPPLLPSAKPSKPHRGKHKRTSSQGEGVHSRTSSTRSRRGRPGSKSVENW